MTKKAHPKSLQEAEILAEDMRRVAYLLQTPMKRLDADETNMLALQLEQMRSRVYEEAYPAIKARAFLPVSFEVDPGAENFSFERTDYVGSAERITNFADDLRTVETSGQKEVYSLNSYGNAYNYSIHDLQRAAFTGRPLSARKALAARRIWERKLDDVAALGDAPGNIATGMINDANVSIEGLANAGTWATKIGAGNVDHLLADANALVRAVVVDSKELYAANRILMPLDQYMLFSQTRLADTGETVLEAFLRANPMIERVDSWNKLSGAGAGATDRMVAYEYNPEVAELVIAQDFTVLPPQVKNLAFQVLAHGRTGGCTVMRPLGMKYMDGI